MLFDFVTVVARRCIARKFNAVFLCRCHYFLVLNTELISAANIMLNL